MEGQAGLPLPPPRVFRRIAGLRGPTLQSRQLGVGDLGADSADPKLPGLLKQRFLRAEGQDAVWIDPFSKTSASASGSVPRHLRPGASSSTTDSIEQQLPDVSPAAAADMAAGSPHFPLETPPDFPDIDTPTASPHYSLGTPPGTPAPRTKLFQEEESTEEGEKPPSSDDAEDEVQYEWQFDLMNNLPPEKAVSLVNLLKDSKRQRAQAAATAHQLQRRVSRLEGLEETKQEDVSTAEADSSSAKLGHNARWHRLDTLLLGACIALVAAFAASRVNHDLFHYTWTGEQQRREIVDLSPQRLTEYPRGTDDDKSAATIVHESLAEAHPKETVDSAVGSHESRSPSQDLSSNPERSTQDLSSSPDSRSNIDETAVGTLSVSDIASPALQDVSSAADSIDAASTPGLPNMNTSGLSSNPEISTQDISSNPESRSNIVAEAVGTLSSSDIASPPVQGVSSAADSTDAASTPALPSTNHIVAEASGALSSSDVVVPHVQDVSSAADSIDAASTPALPSKNTSRLASPAGEAILEDLSIFSESTNHSVAEAAGALSSSVIASPNVQDASSAPEPIDATSMPALPNIDAPSYALYMGPGIEFCNDGVLSEWSSSGQSDCELRCSGSTDCKYISFWSTGGFNWCRLSTGCTEQLVQVEHTISVYAKQEKNLAAKRATPDSRAQIPSTMRQGISADILGVPTLKLHHAAIAQDVAAPRDASAEKDVLKGRQAVVTASVNVINNGGVVWPASTRLRLVVGPGMGLGILPMNNAIHPGGNVELTLQFELPGGEDANTLIRSGWVLESNGIPFGPVLLLEVHVI